jgi:hypothetical protein
MAAKSKRSDTLTAREIARVATLRRLARVVVTSGEIARDDRLAIWAALESFADQLQDPPKSGRPPTTFYAEQRFAQLTAIYWLGQTAGWRAKKSIAAAGSKIAELTGWKQPRRSAKYTRLINLVLAGIQSKSAADLDEHKAELASLVAPERRDSVSGAIGLRKK